MEGMRGAPAAPPEGAVDRGDPPVRARVGSAPVSSVEGFEGPLDWLPEMARAGTIELAPLSIVALIEAFRRPSNGRWRRGWSGAAAVALG